MPFVIRPAGDTDLSHAQIFEETGFPQVVPGFAAGAYEVGRLTWAPGPVSVTEAVAAPVAAGGVGAQSYVEGTEIPALDISTDFTGDNLSFVLAPGSDPLPSGLTLSVAGLLQGIPTEQVSGRTIIVRGTNSIGHDDTAFSIDVAASLPHVGTASTPSTLFQRELDKSFSTSTITIVNRFPGADFAGRSDLRLQLRGPVDAVYIGHQKGVSGDDAYNFAAQPEQVLFGGSGILGQAISDSAVSDAIAFVPNGTDNVLIAIEIDAAKTYSYGDDAAQALPTFYNLNVVEAGSIGKTGYSSTGATSNTYAVERILSYDPPAAIYPGKIIFDGNSIVNGFNVNPGEDFPTLVADLTGAAVIEVGVNSHTTAERRAANDTAPHYAPGSTAVLFEITNDLYFGADAATAQANYQGWCEDVRGLGYAVFACTVLPRSNPGTPTSFENDRQTVNAWLRANYGSFADGLIDFAADSSIGDAGDETNRTYYADDVHPGPAGHAVLAELTRAALNMA
ncbi:MAG: GDSL-type esterase/lipase family protein [Pseudomonadota bacterium]